MTRAEKVLIIRALGDRAEKCTRLSGSQQLAGESLKHIRHAFRDEATMSRELAGTLAKELQAEDNRT